MQIYSERYPNIIHLLIDVCNAHSAISRSAVLRALDDAVHDSQADLTDSDALTFYLLFYSIPGPTLIQSGPTFLKYLQTVRRTASTKVAGSQATVRYQS